MMEGFVVAGALALGALVQTVAGFGSALVAMPILSLAIAVQTAAPIQALLAMFVTSTVLYKNWHGLRWREAARLVAGSVVGIPIGTLALKWLPAAPVTACLGVILLAYGGFVLWRRFTESEGPAESAIPKVPKAVSWCVGFCSGLLGGAYATDGPPLIVYGAVLQWPKATFKSILQSCFLINGVLVVTCHAASGLITRDVLFYCLCAAPGVVVGTIAGLYLDRRVNHDRFRSLLLGLILVLGVVLVVRSIQSGI